MTHRSVPLLFALLLALPGAARAQSESVTLDCSQVPVVTGEELRSLPEITAEGGELRTTLDVQMKPFCIPYQDTTVNPAVWKMKPANLRMYVYADPKTGKETWGLPGPTLRLRKTEPSRKGDSLSILLKNSLEPSSGECASACPATTACKCDDPVALKKLIDTCAGTATQDCCCVINCTQKAPNCFHGQNDTNLHFHGGHVSPQEPQDNPLLELRPRQRGAAQPESSLHGAHGPHGNVYYGEYHYRIPEFGPNQAPGTHWYHPHKHGSTSLQVANGMAGALIIEGSLDDFLRDYYAKKKIKYTEKVLVTQQINGDLNLYTLGATISPPLVNGQVTPTITGEPGEIQRWRIVNATMSSVSQIKITFPANVLVGQIAMDGIQFSPVNYGCQPLNSFNPKTMPSSTWVFPCNSPPFPEQVTPGNNTVYLSPGNRADFLVQLPFTTGVSAVRRAVVGEFGKEAEQRVLLREKGLRAGAAEDPVLFSISVKGEGRLKSTGAGPDFPKQSEWPAMPDYLRNITDAEVTGNSISVVWQQTKAGTNEPLTKATSPSVQFRINGVQFDPACANITTTLGTAMEWSITNPTQLNHPFHIHTNAFQMVSFAGVPVQKTGPEPVWMDTLALPKPVDATTPCSGATCPAAVLRQRYEDFTGIYVLHCHFLGHEDRGMMQMVQTLCKDKPGYYGLADGKTPECAGTVVKALDACPTVVTPIPAAPAGGGRN